MQLKGIIPPVVTPMTAGGEIDEQGLQTIIDFLIDKGVDGIFTVGTTGEFWALSRQQTQRIYRRTAEIVAGRVPVCLGVATNWTDEAIELTGEAAEAGCDFVSILTPFFVRPNEAELFDFYAAVAEAVDARILLYSNPPRTGVPIPTPLAARLAETYPNVVGIKDSSGDLTQTTEYIAQCPEGFTVLCGRDSIILSVLLSGGAGAVASSANVVPEIVVGLYESFVRGDLDKARELQFRLLPFRKAFSLGTFPAVIKAAMNLRGLPAGATRGPIGPLKPENIEALKKILADLVPLAADCA